MKFKYIIAAVALLAAAGASAQHEQYHVYRNDHNFTTLRNADVKAAGHGGTPVSSLDFTMTDGTVESIALDVIDSVQVRATGVPEFHIVLQDHPEWTELQGAKDDVHPATLRMDGCGMYDDVPEQTVEFRGRGNSTWTMDKKPYRFKMSKKASVCGLPKAKTFALLANYIDCSLMRNAVALWTASYLDMPFSNHSIPVKVYFNGIYKGAYMLTEKIGVGGGSVDIDENTGMLFELDSTYDEDFRFYYHLKDGTTSATMDGVKAQDLLPVMVKDPDLTEVADDADAYFAQWRDDFVKMADAVMNTPADGSLRPWLDLDQAARYLLVNSLAANHELQHPKSLYMHKEQLGTDAVYKLGPVWDFDWAFTFGDAGENVPANVPLVRRNGDCGGYTFIKALYANDEFREVYAKLWQEFVADGYPKLLEWMEEYATLIEPSAKENGLLWPDDPSGTWRKGSFEFRRHFEALKAWLAARIEYCNSHPQQGII